MRFLKSLSLLFLLHCMLFSGISLTAHAEPSTLGEPSGGFKGLYGPNYPLVQDSYFTDDYGNILMIINVLGEVGRPGQVVVQESADFATLLSAVGGVTSQANPKKVIVVRKEPESDGTQVYKVDLKKYLKKGDRSSFVVLKPNDTVIIPEYKGLSLAMVNQILGVVTNGITNYYILKQILP